MKDQNSWLSIHHIGLSQCMYALAFLLVSIMAISCAEEQQVAPKESISNSKTPESGKKNGDNFKTYITINNPGFENDWSDWDDTDPSAISGDANSGSHSAKITGSGGQFEQTVTVTTNTDYLLTAYVLDYGTIGVTFGSSNVNDGGNYSNWTKVTVSFNSGSSTSATIYGAYNGGTGRFDDFVLETDDSGGGSSGGALLISSVSASADDGNVAQNTLDGNLSTRWSAEGDGQYITFDLGTSQTVGSIKIAWHNGDQRVADFKVRTGDALSSLTTVYDDVSSGSTLNLETYDFGDVTARYVRITGFGNTQNDWNSITEVEIYGADGSGSGGSGGGGGTSGYPSSLLDLGVWELTLPIPEDNDPNNPKDVYQPELDTYENSTYFHLNSAEDAVVFRAHAGGTTTSGSSYPRSELREMESGYSGNNPKASWSTNSGTHTMYIKEAITHLPDVKKHVVAGQIHDAGDDVIVFRLEDQKLFVDLNGNDGPTLTSNYTLGDIFEVKFVAHNGVIDVYYNDMNNVFWTYNDSAANASGCYFKAGCYTQSNTSKGDNASAYGEVKIYDLWVSHN